jgi:DNA topoisomerase-1
LAGYLGSRYIVESSRGHIRDLPRAAADVPAKYKSEPWARLGVNVDADFEPLYIISPEKKSTVTELKGLLKDVDELYLATDGDREGEAIAWHLLETLKPRIPVKRMVFHEITEPAILEAAENPRDLDIDLVDAQETRRILDRLYGYEVSPVLWKKVAPKLSAGRVQSVATRIIVQRERDRMAFRSASYWDIIARLDASVSDPKAAPPTFTARLTTVDGLRVATGRDFDSLGVLRKANEVTVLDETTASALATALQGVHLNVASVEEKPYTRRPYPPFMTSTLQQEAGRKLRFSSERTMSIAQRLYENGYITYMRTDSTTLSESAISAARTQASQLYGAEYVAPSPRQYTRKVKNAQEAHEAIRPAGEAFATPDAVRRELDGDEFRLYELIWQRTVASQMADARGTTLSLRIAGAAGDRQVVFSASGRTLTFAGFLKAYVETVDDQAGGEADDAESRLPQLTEGQRLDVLEPTPDGHVTNPPARYTEASLIKALEELGIGRPSTYSSIIKTIQDRGYVHKKGSALVPS